jgi:CRP-like cAMP-binding protein
MDQLPRIQGKRMDQFSSSNAGAAMLEAGHRQTVETGQIIYHQGEPVDTVALITIGEAAGFSYSENGDETWVCQFREGQLVGTLAALSSDVLIYEIQALTDVTLIRIPLSDFNHRLETDPQFSRFVIDDLAARLNVSQCDLVKMHTLSVKGRICSELLHMAETVGVDLDHMVIRPSPVFVDLARRLNSTRETVSRTISNLREIGIIKREPGALIITSPDRLRHVIQ